MPEMDKGEIAHQVVVTWAGLAGYQRAGALGAGAVPLAGFGGSGALAGAR
jgi:hypothetical protein